MPGQLGLRQFQELAVVTVQGLGGERLELIADLVASLDESTYFLGGIEAFRVEAGPEVGLRGDQAGVLRAQERALGSQAAVEPDSGSGGNENRGQSRQGQSPKHIN